GGKDDEDDEDGEEGRGQGDAKAEAEKGQDKKAKKSDVRVITEIRYKADGIHHLLVDEGYKHLFVVDMAAADLDGAEKPEARQLTDGDWDDATPARSPDGGTPAFA